MDIKNIKVTLLVFFGLLFLGYAVFSMAEENSSSTMNIALDSDQDGLSDEEEKTYGTDPNDPDSDNDGYKDSAEVQSGYDPLKPAPGDKLVDETTQSVSSEKTETGSDKISQTKNTNITSEISQQIAALFSEKSASGNKEISIDDLDALIQNFTNNSVSLDSLSEIKDEDINIVKTKCKNLSDEECAEKEKDAVVEYLTAVSYIIFNNSPKEIKSEEEVSSFFEEMMVNFSLFTSGNDNSFFNDIAERAGKTSEELKKIEVPEKMVEFHKKGLQLAKYGVEINDKTEITNADPINNIISFVKVRDYVGLLMEFMESATTELEKYGIDDLPINL